MSTQRENADDEHPGWCSPARCYRTEEEGVRVHVQAPACWEDDAGETRFETGLVGPEDEPSGTTYLELALHSVFVGGFVYAALPLGDARRLRDQLSTHLDAAELGRRNRVGGVDGRLMTSSDEPAHADGAEWTRLSGPDFAPQPAVNDTQLAVLFRQVQWALDDAAHDWPAGRVTPHGREELAGTLESLATIVQASIPGAVVIDSET